MSTRTPVRIEPRKHPAKFSDPIIEAIRLYVNARDPHGTWRILDPFGGVGRVHRLAACPDPSAHVRPTIATELEPEWAVQGGARSAVADAHRLPFPDATFHAIVTSPCYGNRLADQYDGKGQCRKCNGHPAALDGTACDRCDGTGRDTSTRLTYRISLDRPPSPNSATTLRWGPDYRRFHRVAWAEAARVLRPDGVFILNVSDFLRLSERQGVPVWHANTIEGLGFKVVGRLPIATARYGNGSKGSRRQRMAAEEVIVFERTGDQDAPAR